MYDSLHVWVCWFCLLPQFRLTRVIRHLCGISANSPVESCFAIPSRRLPFGKGVPLGYCLALPWKCHCKVKLQVNDLQVNYACGFRCPYPGVLSCRTAAPANRPVINPAIGGANGGAVSGAGPSAGLTAQHLELTPIMELYQIIGAANQFALYRELRGVCCLSPS